MEDFAEYILNEHDYIQKMIIAYYMAEKTGIYFDKSTILRTEIARMFINYASLDVDQNRVLTAMLLCNCKKIDNNQKYKRIKTYAKEGAEYLATLGFDKDFCKICEGVNHYSEMKNRKKESDILELVDQFTSLILTRAERDAFSNESALIILKERNLKDVPNRYLVDFILFIKAMENVHIRDNVDVPVIRKLAYLTEREKNIKSLIAKLGNRYSKEIDRLMQSELKRQAEQFLYNKQAIESSTNATTNKQETNHIEKTIEKAQNARKKLQTAHKYTRKINKYNPNRALFSQEVADRIRNHDISFKFD